MKVLSEPVELNSAANLGLSISAGSSSHEWEEETTTNADVRQSQVTNNTVGALPKSGEVKKKRKKKKKVKIVERTPNPQN